MKNPLRIAAAFTALLVGWTASAQDFGGWSLPRLADEMSAIQRLPLKGRLVRVNEILARYMVDQAWGLSLEGGPRAGARKPTVAVRMDAENVNVRDGIITLPTWFADEMTAVGLLVGHDLVIADNGEIAVVDPVVFKPFGSASLLSVLSDMGAPTDAEQRLALLALAAFARCNLQQMLCVKAQNAAAMCGMLFVFAHEIAHVLAEHPLRAEGEYPLDEELFADARAQVTLRRYLDNMRAQGEAQDALEQQACLDAPVAYFELKRRAAPPGVSLGYGQRKDAYVLALGIDFGGDAEQLVEPSTTRGGLGRLSIIWSSPPSIVTIDGVAVGTADVNRLVLTAGTHRLLAASSEGLVYEKFRVNSGDTTSVDATLTRFRGPVALPVLQELLKERRWYDLLLLTSNSGLRPRSSDVTVLQWKALKELKMGAWIDLRDGATLPENDRRRGRIWRNNGFPIVDWDDDLAFVD